MKRIAVFGATGRTGLRVASAALERGLTVRALCRSDAAAALLPDGVETVVALLDDPAALDRVVAGADAVISTLGPRLKAPEPFCAGATRAVVEAMRRQGVARFVCVTGAMIGDYPRRSLFVRTMAAMFRRAQPAIAADRAEQEHIVRLCDRNWTLAKPPRLTDGPTTGYVLGVDRLVTAFSRVARSDLAAALLDLATSVDYSCASVIVESR